MERPTSAYAPLASPRLSTLPYKAPHGKAPRPHALASYTVRLPLSPPVPLTMDKSQQEKKDGFGRGADAQLVRDTTSEMRVSRFPPG